MKLYPVVMYFHGGGWVPGGADTHDRLVRELANGAHAAIFFIIFLLQRPNIPFL
jgi:acetyl esterase